jgi:hypothetical protein
LAGFKQVKHKLSVDHLEIMTSEDITLKNGNDACRPYLLALISVFHIPQPKMIAGLPLPALATDLVPPTHLET